MNKQFEQFCTQIITLFARTLGRIPKNQGTRLGALLGRIIFMLDKRHRRIAVQNLSLAFGNEKDKDEIHRLAGKTFENMGKILFEVCWSLNQKKEILFNRYFTVEGLSNIKNAYEKGRGVLVLTGHFGCWELLPVAGAMTGYPNNIIYRPLDFRPLDDFIGNIRTRFGAKIIYRKKSIRKILKSLNRGEVVSLLLDQNVDWYEGVFVDFFGHRACTSTGMALLALKTGAPVIPVFLRREKEVFTARFLPEIPLIQTGDRIKDIETNTENYNKAIENIIRQYPDQWFWVHSRWKTKPYRPWPGKHSVSRSKTS